MCNRRKSTSTLLSYCFRSYLLSDLKDLADGDVCEAKRAIRSMRRLARGIDSDDECSYIGTAPTEGVEAMRTSQIGDYSVVRKGKKFVLRRMERKKLVDIGK